MPQNCIGEVVWMVVADIYYNFFLRAELVLQQLTVNGRENGPDLSRASRREVRLYKSQLHLTDSESSL